MDQSSTTFDRRTLLASLGVAAAGGMFFSDARKTYGQVSAFDQDAGLDYVRLRARLDGKPVFWLARGIKFALSNFELIPVHGFNMLAGTISSPVAEGGYLFRMFEAPYATDLDTGDVINEYNNPLIDQVIPIPHVNPLTVQYELTRDGEIIIPANDPRVNTTNFIGSVVPRKSIGANLRFEESFVLRTPSSDADGDESILSEMLHYSGDSESISEDGGFYGDASQSIVVLRNGLEGPTVNGFPPMLVATYEGRKFLTFSEAVREAGEDQMEATHPGFLAQLESFS